MLATVGPDATAAATIRTPDQRVRVFVSSTLQELADERGAVRDAVKALRLVPVMFELGARPHPPRQVYRAYLAQSQVFVGVYWQNYGWVAPGEEMSGLEDEYRLSAGMPRLIYVKSPAPAREPRLTDMLARIKDDDSVSYQRFSDSAELQRLVENDLAVLLSERFEMTRPAGRAADPASAAVAAGLGLNTSGGRLCTDLVSYLRGKRLLLVLDNFEQVTEAAPMVAELLAAAPGLVTLVTSRTVLRVSGEYELCVPPLAVPPSRDAGNLDEYASVRLFVARADAAAPGFELTGRNAQAIAEICRRLDGLPLAIELAAARIRMLPPSALLARLDDRMSMLTAGPRDLPERQRTLRNTLDWSFGLLSADEKALFARLGVFAGTFGLPAAEAVCGDADPSTPGGPPGRTVDTLSSLVDSSLVRPEPREDEPRFSLLETIRVYALERLRESGDWQEVHDRHAAYFLSLAEPAYAELHGAGQLAWLNRLEIRRGNLNAALSWLTDTDQLGAALHLIWTTWRFWWLHGHAGELGRHVDEVLAKSASLPPRQRALALSAAGFVRFAGGDQARARRLLKQSLPLYRQAGDRLGMGLTAAALGHLLAAKHQAPLAIDLLEQTLIQLREMAGEELTAPERLQHQLDLALASNFLGQIKLDQEDRQRAAELFTEGLTAARSAADRFTILVSLYDLAVSRQARGDLSSAADLLRQGLSLAAEAGDEPGLAYYLEALAAVVARQGQPALAVSLLAASGALLEANGSGWLHAYVPRAPHDNNARTGLRARMTDAAFQQAWAYGRSLTSISVVRYALEETMSRPDHALAS